MKRKKNHEQFHTARPTEYEQATKNAFRSATLVYGFLTDFGAHSTREGRFHYGMFWQVGRFNR